MTTRIPQFPPFVVCVVREDGAWLVICREHGWLYSSYAAATSDATWLAQPWRSRSRPWRGRP